MKALGAAEAAVFVQGLHGVSVAAPAQLCSTWPAHRDLSCPEAPPHPHTSRDDTDAMRRRHALTDRLRRPAVVVSSLLMLQPQFASAEPAACDAVTVQPLPVRQTRPAACIQVQLAHGSVLPVGLWDQPATLQIRVVEGATTAAHLVTDPALPLAPGEVAVGW